MQELVLKRYLLECGYECGRYYRMLDANEVSDEIQYQNEMFKQLQSGKLQINRLYFESWYRRLCQDKKIFVNHLKELGFLNEQQNVFELTEDQNMPGLGINDFHLNVQKLIEHPGKSYQLDKELKPFDGCLVINGMYQGEMTYIKNAIKNGSFLVGYCGDATNEYTARVVRHYQKLKTKLNISGIKEIEEYDDRVCGVKRVYVLNYNNRRTYPKPIEFVSKTHSER